MIGIVPNYILEKIDKMFLDGGFPEQAKDSFKISMLDYLDKTGELPPLESIKVFRKTPQEDI